MTNQGNKINILHLDNSISFLNSTKDILEKISKFELKITIKTELYDKFNIDLKNYDIIITDLTIKSVSMLDVISDLKKTYKNHIPFIIYANINNKSDIIRALNLGVKKFVEKGNDVETITENLYDYITDVFKKHSFEKMLISNESKYKILLDQVPILVWEQNWSKLKKRLDDLRKNGIKTGAELREFFIHNRDQIKSFARLIDVIDVNQAVLDFFDFVDKNEIIGPLERFLSKDSEELFINEVTTFFDGNSRFSTDLTTELLTGKRVHTHIQSVIPHGYEESYSRVILTISDLTKQKIQEEEFLKTESKIWAILKAIPDLMFELNKDGIHLTYHGDRNKFFVPPEKFIGKSVSDVLPENVAKKYLQMIHRTIELKESQNFEYNLLINNKLHYYNASMVTMGEENVLVLVRDITEHKMIDILLREREQFELSRNLKNEEQKFQFIVQNAPNIIITTNLVGEISFINQDFLNFPYYSLIGKSIIDLINPIETFRIERYIKNVIESGSPISYDIESENDSGKVWFHINLGLLMEDNIPKSLIFIITDITNEKKTEDQLRIQTAEIQEKNKELQEFAHIVSHDLKTPLKTISSMVHLIQSDDINLDIVLVKDHLKRIDERVNMMEDLIDGILQYSNIGLIEDSQEDVNLHELLKEVIKSLNPDKPFNINVSQDLPFMKINKFRVYQIFQNLLSNAIKYNDKDEIKISIVGNIFDSSYYQIKVSDNGKGIKSEHFDLIFQIFKTPNEIRKPNSTGVGLAIVKKIINFLEGVIWVESKIGFGSSFIFLIPLKYFSTNQRK